MGYVSWHCPLRCFDWFLSFSWISACLGGGYDSHMYVQWQMSHDCATESMLHRRNLYAILKTTRWFNFQIFNVQTSNITWIMPLPQWDNTEFINLVGRFLAFSNTAICRGESFLRIIPLLKLFPHLLLHAARSHENEPFESIFEKTNDQKFTPKSTPIGGTVIHGPYGFFYLITDGFVHSLYPLDSVRPTAILNGYNTPLAARHRDSVRLRLVILIGYRVLTFGWRRRWCQASEKMRKQ